MKNSHVLVLSVATSLATAANAGDVPIEIIAAPGGGFGTDIQAFTTARINAGGQVQFVARINDDPDPTFSVLYVGVPGALTPIASEGPFDSTIGHIVNLELAEAPVNDAGNVLMYFSIGGPGITSSNDRRITSGVTTCAAEDALAPGTGGLLFRDFTSFLPRMNNLGTAPFVGRLEGGTPIAINQGVWVCNSGGTTLHIREGDAAPGMPAGATIALFGQIGGINDAEQIIFTARVSGGGVDSTNDRGLWLGPLGAPTLVARRGDPVPGVVGDVNYGTPPDWPGLNDAGQMAFAITLTGTDVVLGTNNAIMTGTTGNLSMAMREGDVAPGAGGAVFSFFDHPVIDAGGRIAFRANLTGAGVDATNDRGIWTGLPGAVTLVAREGSAPPNADPGDVFDLIRHPVMNGLGQVAFQSNYNNGGSAFKGLWATDTNGVLIEVIRDGDTIDIGGGDLRTVVSPELEHRSNFGSGGQDGRPRCFNDAGQLAFDVRFTDFTEAIVRASVGDGGPAPCPADGDGSGGVGIEDFLAVLAQWGNDCMVDPCTADANGDGFIGIEDFLKVLADWGPCP